MPEYGRASIKVTPDLTGFRKELEAKLKEIDTNLTVNVNVDLDTGKATAEMEAWRKAQSGKKVNQNVDVDKGKAWEALEGISSRLLQVSASGGRAALGIAGVVSAIDAVSATAPTLLQTAGLLALLPAAAGAGAAALLTIKLGLDGIKTAAKPLNSVISTLETKVSSTFEKSLAPAVRNLHDLIPQTTNGFVGMAKAISESAINATKLWDQKSSIRNTNALIDASVGVVRNLGAAIGPVVQGLINIGAIGGPVLRNLTSGVGDVSQKFLTWTESARGIQQIKDWINGALTSLRNLWTVGSAVVDIVRQIVGALNDAGIGIGGIFGGAALELDKFLHTAEGQSALHELADTLKTVSDVVRNVLNAALQQLAPILEAAGPAIREIVTQLGTKLVNAINTVGPIVKDFFQFLSDHKWAADLVADLLAVAAAIKLISSASKLATKALGALPGSVGKAGAKSGTSFGSSAASAIRGISWAAIGLDIVNELTSSWFSEMSGGKINSLWEAAWQGFFGGDGVGDNGIFPWIGKAFGDLLPNIIEGSPDARSEFLHGVLGIPTDDELHQAIDEALGNNFKAGGVLDSAWGDANNIWRTGLNDIGSVTDVGFANIGATVSNTMFQARAAISSGIGAASLAVSGSVGGIVSSISSGFSQVGSIASTSWRDVAGFVSGNIGDATAAVSGGVGSMVGSVANAFGTAIPAATSSGLASWLGAINSNIGSAVGSVAVGMGAITSSVGSAMGFVAGQGWSGVGAFAAGISGAGASAVGAMAGVSNGVRGAAYVDLRPVGSAIAQGLANGIWSNIGSAVAAASSMASQVGSIVRSVAGVHSPSKMMYDIGKWLPPGFANGIDSTADAAVQAAAAMVRKVQSVASSVVATADSGRFSVDYGTVSDATWNQLLAAGWKGDPTDGKEALYAPTVEASSSIEDRVAAALSSWTFQQDPQGQYKLIRKAGRDNLVRR
ncbi:hypothetical protein FPZ12_029595 [Amycolatopsis acidicola]|uniref:Tape measure protein n=1 Tax=Amycolatopsis acidicola TaxID=2596893 RepID=A0A5N0UZK4_9PSEU|nr:hypothetical protein [Amycolatopsis acidicola]KAA9155552.1 hypothetical protein FPZ12_029595 [Amycolatopsis acidicola]